VSPARQIVVVEVDGDTVGRHDAVLLAGLHRAILNAQLQTVDRVLVLKRRPLYAT